MPEYSELLSPTTQFSGAPPSAVACHLTQIKAAREIGVIFGEEIDRRAIERSELANLVGTAIGALTDQNRVGDPVAVRVFAYHAHGGLGADVLRCTRIRRR